MAGPIFKDYFSSVARDYARYRVRYPRELFAALAKLAPGTRLAWDCGAGNGQAAWGLADHFTEVVATDASAEQIAQAPRHARITFRVEPAETTSLAAGSVDLIAAAQAVHWFDLPRFWEAVRKVAKPKAVVAVWCYELPVISPAVDAVVRRFERETLDGCWAPEIRLVWEGYKTLAFPFQQMELPPLQTSTDWTLDDLVGHLHTWSAVSRFRREKGVDPVEGLLPALVAAWGDAASPKRTAWPIFSRVGRVS